MPDLPPLADLPLQDLKIEDLHLGSGRACMKGDLILTHYTGWLGDGRQFESSHERGRPFECVIGVRRVIQGWDQGLMGMREGGRRRLYVPARLAYGERQVNARIPPHSDLVFEIELLELRRRDD